MSGTYSLGIFVIKCELIDIALLYISEKIVAYDAKLDGPYSYDQIYVNLAASSILLNDRLVPTNQ